MTRDEFFRYDIREMLWIMHSRTRRIEDSLHTANIMIRNLQQTEDRVMATIADIKAKVEAEKTVEDSMVALLQSISQQLKDAIANNDPAAMQEIVDMLDNNTAVLSKAIVDNTPAV